ncbi:hypothetical protein [uncultured Ruegeria sp.]|uniref:hypothetical protein n=1 Tax=uncultured Ruegeria sp. TaxID=259304 RepID=UPI00260B8C83|nr:hypothetical protein [uncultured Ruegeria sp.]
MTRTDIVSGASHVANTTGIKRLNRRLRQPRRSRRGALGGLVGMMLGLVLALIILAGIYTLFTGIRDQIRSAQLQTQLIRAVSVIDRAHSYSGIFANGSLLGFLNGEGFSSRELMRDANNNWIFTSPFDTDIMIVGDGTRDFTVTISGLPPGACRSAALAFQDRGSGLDSLTIQATAVALPMTEAAVGTACDNDLNVVALTF